MPILTALLALAVSAAPSKELPLAGCEATPVKYGWQYDCEELRARLEDRAEDAGRTTKYVEGMEKGVAAVVGDGAVARRERRKLGGADVEVHVTEARGEPRAAFVASVAGKAGTRVLVCIGQNRRCGAVLSSLAALPWGSVNAPGSIRKAPAPLAIAGRAVPVPQGCDSTTQPRGGRIECGSAAWVGWAMVDDGQARRMSDQLGDSIRAGLARPGLKGSEDAVPCRIAGAEATCARMVLEAKGQRALMLWGSAPAGDDVVFASCMSPGGPEIGSPCALVFGAR